MSDLQELEELLEVVDEKLFKMIETFLPDEIKKENRKLHKEKKIIKDLFFKDPTNFKLRQRLILNTEKIISFNQYILGYVESLKTED